METGPDEYLLDAAAGAGLRLPAMRLQVRHRTCACRLLEGSVDQSEARRFYPLDREEGWALVCTAYPRSDVKLLTH